jgi:glutamine amidotransferase
MAERIALIDYGAGNLQSVRNALKAAGAENVVLCTDVEDLRTADRIVLPGVGAFAACMNGLSALPGVIDALREMVLEKGRPFLGICVGMQLLADAGEEYGRHRGLGWIGGTVRPLKPADPALKVPHMGWNDVHVLLRHDLIAPGEAYYLHSYAFEADNPAHVLATTDHGGPVTAIVGRDTIIGVQFHPEKSQAYGLSFLSRFLNWHP